MTTETYRCVKAVAALLVLLGSADGLRADDAEAQAVKTVYKVGGCVSYEAGVEGKPVIAVSFPNCGLTDENLKVLAAFDHLQSVQILSPNLTDAGLKHL